jgi:ligand-binding sensor domain-containing protein
MTTIPMIKNYSKTVYKGGTQTWDICESKDGLIFFANNDGLLVFDGNTFTKNPLPKNTILRSIHYNAKQDRLYVGGQNEIGYFKNNTNGSLLFTSLANLLPKGLKGFEDIWSIKEYHNKIYFQTSGQVLVYDGQDMTILSPSENSLENLYLVGERLLLTDDAGSIFEITDSKSNRIIKESRLDISSILPYKDNKLLITTYKNGIFVLNNSNNTMSNAGFNDADLKNNRIYRACMYAGYYVLASNRAGVYFLNSNGEILNNIDLKNGLQNNNVLSVYKDKNNNIWLGLDNGIDLIRLNYPYGYIQPDGLLKGTGYTGIEQNGNYYFGTNNGLYVKSIPNNSANGFKLVSNTEGQVWWIQQIKGKLFACHHEGLFEVAGDLARKIADTRGCWKLIPLEKHPGYYLMGTYNGLSLFKWENNSLLFIRKLARFKESSRFIEEDDAGNIWIGHPYKGIYKITISRDLQSVERVRLYNSKDGLPDENENYVFTTDLGLSFATSKGIYKYRGDLDKFEPLKSLAQLDSSKAYKRLFNGLNGNIWFINNEEIGYLKPTYNGVDYTYSKVILPKIDQNLVGGFEFLQESKEGNVFIGVESGFVTYNLKATKKYTQQAPVVLITTITSLTHLDSIYYQRIPKAQQALVVADRSIEFSFSSPNAYFYNDLLFSSYLEGWEKKWSAWKPADYREFSQLAYGDYTFHIKARCMGIEGPETTLRIHIPAPWYWTKYAKFSYSLIALFGVLLIGFFPQMLVRKKASRLIAEKGNQFKQQTELLLIEKEKQEKELIELKNQQLVKDLEHQGKELASSTMHIVQKSEKLLSIKDKLKRILQISNDPKIKPEISSLIRDIDQDTLIDQDWKKFELYFNNIHESFTYSLKEKFPQLSANDIKMCAYLRMNLSTKEIATILNISVRGVEISRYRLRKKMELALGTNLSDYLSRL